jgi:cytochrome c oxidase assembly protein Cox11
MSKGMKGDKALKKLLNKEKTVDETKKVYENSLEMNKHIKVKFNTNFEIAKIIDIRPNKEFD